MSQKLTVAARKTAPEFIPSRNHTSAVSERRDITRSSLSSLPQRYNHNITNNSESPRPRKHQSNQRKQEKLQQASAAESAASPKNTYYDFPAVNKRGEISLNHLLNFTFPERQHFSSITTPPRRKNQAVISIYNKERFVNANFRFVMRDSGDYTVNIFDPDILVVWEDVVQVVIHTLQEPTCPICLSPPTPAKVTRCGHIFCYACVLHYLALGERKWRKCPICYDAIYAKDLRSVKFDIVTEVKPGAVNEGLGLKMVLMKRLTNSTVALPRVQHGRWLEEQSIEAAILPNVQDVASSRFSKLVSSPIDFQRRLLEDERDELVALHLAPHDMEEGIYIDTARAEVEAALADLEAISNIPDPCSRGGNRKGKSRELLSSRSASNTSTARSLKAAFERYEKSPLSQHGTSRQPSPISNVSASEVQAYDSNMTANSIPITAPLSTLIVHPPDVAGSGKSLSTICNIDSIGTLSSSKMTPSNQPPKDNAYYFYQAADGTHVYLHPLDIKIFLREYGEYSAFPDFVEVGVLSVRESTLDEDLRKRCKYLSHLPLSCDVTFCEVDLSQLVSSAVLDQFSRELTERNRRLAAEKRADLVNEHRYQRYQSSACASGERLMPALRIVSPEDLELHIPQGDDWGLPPGQIAGSYNSNVSGDMSGISKPTTGTSPPVGTTPAPGLSFARMASNNANTAWVTKPPFKQFTKSQYESQPSFGDEKDSYYGEADAWTLDLESAVLDGGNSSNNPSIGKQNKKKKSKGITLVSNSGTRGCT